MLLFYIFKRVPKVYPKFYHFTRNLVCSESYLSNIGVLLQHILLPFPCIPLLFPSLDRYLECSFWKLSSSPSSTSSSSSSSLLHHPVPCNSILLPLLYRYFRCSFCKPCEGHFSYFVLLSCLCHCFSSGTPLQHHSHHHQHHYQNHHSHHVIFSIIVFTRPMLFFFSCLST